MKHMPEKAGFQDEIRFARPEDSEALLEIYAPYITDTAITFETEVPSPEAFAERIEGILEFYPFLVYVNQGKIAAYAYAAKNRERAAYCYNVDVSVYARQAYHGSGVAHRLYRCLFAILKEQGFHNAYAGYTVPNEKSRLFHRKFDFHTVGTYRNTGYKLGKWHDVTWAEKTILPHRQPPAPLKPVTDIPEAFYHALFQRILQE